MHEVIHSLSPFLWKGQGYNVLQCEYVEGQPTVVVDPPCPDLVEAMKKRLFPRSGSSKVYHAFGYKCFEEDYTGG
jgi:hypothetical protein